MYSKSNKERKDNQISCTFAVSNTLNEKDMKKLTICITLIAAILTGCNGDEKAAQARLDKARAMYENNEFFGAKNEIDSIRALYPKEVKVLKQGLTLMRQVEVKEAERNIAFCDSLLPIKLDEVEGLKKGFAFEKDSVYEEIGNYIWKQQTIERNVQRCYVRCGVNEEGEMYLANVVRFIEDTKLADTPTEICVEETLSDEDRSKRRRRRGVRIALWLIIAATAAIVAYVACMAYQLL